MNAPIAYTYEADVHCPECCRKRFGNDYGDNPDTVDNEGNHIGALYNWDEWYNIGQGNQTLSCGTCRDVIDTYEESGESVCPGCYKEFDAYTSPTQKTRMGELFCSLECADKAFPNFKEKNKRG